MSSRARLLVLAVLCLPVAFGTGCGGTQSGSSSKGSSSKESKDSALTSSSSCAEWVRASETSKRSFSQARPEVLAATYGNEDTYALLTTVCAGADGVTLDQQGVTLDGSVEKEILLSRGQAPAQLDYQRAQRSQELQRAQDCLNSPDLADSPYCQ